MDVHSLFALRRLYALRAGEAVAEQPELSREMRALVDPLPLYLGMLFHDAGKGLGGSHSLRGKELMAEVGARLSLTPRQREVAEFLVLQHLLMSHTAQRRDLSDPKLVAEFARSVGDIEKLTCLYLLTYADIASVGPNMWNAWKARLLKELFDKARAELSGAHEPGEVTGPSRAFRAAWTKRFGAEVADELALQLPPRYFAVSEPSRAVLDGRMIRSAGRRTLQGFVRRKPGAEVSELTLVARDRPGLLALFAGVLSAHRIDILRARIASTREGVVLDVFDVRGPGGRGLEPSKWRAARTDLVRILRGELTVEEVFRKRRGTSLLQRRLPQVSTRVGVDNAASHDFTIVDVQAEDRVGLLYAIASAVHGFGAEIALAQVATEAHRATDSFYVRRGEAKISDPSEVARLQACIEEALEKLA